MISDTEFQIVYQRTTAEIARMYGTAMQLMEIEMGTDLARLLAPHYLGDIVAAAERLAVEELNRNLMTALTDEGRFTDGEGEDQELTAKRRVQLTIDDALKGSEPW